MIKLLLGMALLGSMAFAEPMPTGTPQAELTDALIGAVSGIVQIDCPPEQDLSGVQVTCAEFNLSPLSFLWRWDDKLFIAENGPEYEPALQGFAITAQAEDWAYHSDSNRYERSYDFEGGVYRVVYAPFSDLGGSITINFTP